MKGKKWKNGVPRGKNDLHMKEGDLVVDTEWRMCGGGGGGCGDDEEMEEVVDAIGEELEKGSGVSFLKNSEQR